MESFQGDRDDISYQMGLIWSQVKEPVIVPMLRVAVFLCLAMSLMMLVERVYMGIVICLVKLFGRRPEKRYKWEPMKDDVELGNSSYPMVLVQVPMYNEREVIFLLILFYHSIININVRTYYHIYYLLNQQFLFIHHLFLTHIFYISE